LHRPSNVKFDIRDGVFKPRCMKVWYAKADREASGVNDLGTIK